MISIMIIYTCIYPITVMTPMKYDIQAVRPDFLLLLPVLLLLLLRYQLLTLTIHCSKFKVYFHNKNVNEHKL
jgi:hypothetical protein